MKNRLYLVLSTFFAVFLLSKNGFSQVTLSVNGNSSSTVNVDLCEGSPNLTAFTTVFDPGNPSGYYYTWKWYKNNSNTAFWTDPYHYSPQSVLPEDKFEGAAAYKVVLTIANINTTTSNTVTINSTTTFGQYSPEKISNRVVSGDFDNDGKEDDVAAFYYYGNLNTNIHVWKSNGSAFTYQGDNGWWYSSQYNGSNLVGIVSGDFDNDGYKDDIGAFYNYGGTTTELHIFTSNGSSFSFASKWSSSAYDASKIALRVVSGDFDRDGYKDDIATFYGYSATSMEIHVWRSNGSTFSTAASTWYSNNSYTATKITDRVVSGDFDSDGYEDDIVAFYGYSTLETTAHLWSSNSNTGTPTGFTLASGNAWTSTSYESAKISGTVVSGDFDRDGYKDDIAAFYNYGSGSTTAHLWKASATSLAITGSSGWWSSSAYNQSYIKGRVVSGDFDSDTKKDDITMFYYYGPTSIAAHVLLSNSNSASQSTAFNYQGDGGFWSVCSGMNLPVHSDPQLADQEAIGLLSVENLDDAQVTVFPNPSSGKFYISSLNEKSVIEIYNVSGQKVYEQTTEGPQTNYAVEVNDLKKGIYLLKIVSNNMQKQSKIIIE